MKTPNYSHGFKWHTMFLTVLFASIPLVSSVHAGLWDSVKSVFVPAEIKEPPKIRVLIGHDLDVAVVEVKGKYNLYDPHKNKKIGSYFLGKSNLIQPMSGGLKWGEEFPDVFQVLIVPDDANITTVVDGIEYKGLVYIYDVGGRISIVNEVEIEDYVSSVLGLTIEKPLSEEALAAVAITARTQAYYASMSSKNPYWHIEAKQANYQGNGVTNRFKEVEKAILATRYMVMSKTGPYDRVITPIPAQVVISGKARAGLSLADAEARAKKGDNAARILSQSFPNTTIQVVHHDSDNRQNIAEGRDH